jgi:hypothetical protein
VIGRPWKLSAVSVLLLMLQVALLVATLAAS